MIVFIYICILALNVVTVLLTYRFLGPEMDQKKKSIFIIVGIAITYFIVSTVFGVSTKDINLGDFAKTGEKLITFTFVPVNGMLILPFLANSYRHLKLGNLSPEKFKNRCILLLVILIIVLIIEFFYFKDIQTGIFNMVQAGKLDS